MKFAPKPDSSFAEFIRTYFERCCALVPAIEANAGKWRFEDLIPGLSDFDTRFVVRDGMSPVDWCRMSTEVGRVHLELAQERRDWARNLEHLPGVNLQWNELLDPTQYFSEFGKWTFYHGPPGQLDTVRRLIAQHAWSEADEAYHWTTIGTFFGPYNRTIDPPINLGAYENKYSLHSRLMHYFAPPLHAGVCLLERKTRTGKLEAFQQAKSLFPRTEVIELTLQLIAGHYETPYFLTEPGMTELDERLDDYLREMVAVLLGQYRAIRCPPRPTTAELRAAVKELRGPTPLGQLFEQIKFARLMKGRLWFYAQSVDGFDSLWLIRNELNRIRANFYQTPMRLFGLHVLGIDLPAERVLQMLEGGILSREQTGACRTFAALSGRECPDALLRHRALEIAGCFDPFLHALEALLDHAKATLAQGVRIAPGR